MTLRQLLAKTSYKRAFNSIYKQYLKDYSKSKVELFSVNLQKAYDNLSKLQKKECKNIIKVESIANTFCIHICDKDDCAILDFVEWSELIDCKLDAPRKVSDAKLAGLILWDITFWGFTPKQIRKNKDEITKQSLNGESFPLQEYKNREHRLE